MMREKAMNACCNIRAVPLLLSLALLTGKAASADTGPLAAAFLAQCHHTQECALAELASNPDTDPALLQMIQAGMEGKCEAQVAKVSQYEGMPQAQAMTLCYRAASELPCEILRDDPVIPECN